MKQKYTIRVAGIEMNVISEESPEAVEALVGLVDRKMREISLKSKKCPKSEAALLCALEFCADKLAMKTELEAITARAENAEAEIAKLKEENARLTSKLAIGSVAENVDVKAEEPEIPVIDVELPEEKSGVSKKKQSRNKVGSMFDLLTFSDI